MFKTPALPASTFGVGSATSSLTPLPNTNPIFTSTARPSKDDSRAGLRPDLRFSDASMDEAQQTIERSRRDAPERCYKRVGRPQMWFGSWPLRRRVVEVPCPPTTTTEAPPTTTLDPDRICTKSYKVMKGTGLSNAWVTETRVVPCPENAAHVRGKRIIVSVASHQDPDIPEMCETAKPRRFGSGMLGFWKVEPDMVPCDTLVPSSGKNDCTLF